MLPSCTSGSSRPKTQKQRMKSSSGLMAVLAAVLLKGFYKVSGEDYDDILVCLTIIK
jgi:hypothetical protein